MTWTVKSYQTSAGEVFIIDRIGGIDVPGIKLLSGEEGSLQAIRGSVIGDEEDPIAGLWVNGQLLVWNPATNKLNRVRGDSANGLDVDVTRLPGNIPAALAAGGGMKVEGVAGGVAQPVSISGTVVVDTELSPVVDMDTGAGSDPRAVIGLLYAASGGGVLVSAANPLPVAASVVAGPIVRARMTPLTVAFTAGVSAEIDIGGHVLIGALLPASHGSTSSYGFQVASAAGGTYVNLNDDTGNRVRVTPVSSTAVVLPPEVTAFRFVKMVALTTTTTTNTSQTGNVTIVGSA